MDTLDGPRTGQPNDTNAHPHLSGNSKLAIIHNGIIENHNVIREMLRKRGHEFRSDTDTEVLVCLIEEMMTTEKVDLEAAVRLALQQVVGAYAIVVVSQDDPNLMVAARKGSPMVLGIGEKEYFLASDATPIVEYTRNVVYLDEGQIVTVTRDDFKISSIDDSAAQTPTIHELEISLEQLEKGGFDHFMLKEIPRTAQSHIRHYEGSFAS